MHPQKQRPHGGLGISFCVCVLCFLFFFLGNFFGIFTYFIVLTLSRKCFNGQGMLRTSVSDSGSDKKEKKKRIILSIIIEMTVAEKGKR